MCLITCYGRVYNLKNPLAYLQHWAACHGKHAVFLHELLEKCSVCRVISDNFVPWFLTVLFTKLMQCKTTEETLL